jgi:hypothetical protein
MKHMLIMLKNILHGPDKRPRWAGFGPGPYFAHLCPGPDPTAGLFPLKIVSTHQECYKMEFQMLRFKISSSLEKVSI